MRALTIATAFATALTAGAAAAQTNPVPYRTIERTAADDCVYDAIDALTEPLIESGASKIVINDLSGIRASCTKNGEELGITGMLQSWTYQRVEPQ